MKNRKMRKVGYVLLFIAIFAAAIAVVMLLWNALVPNIMSWGAINYWQAAGLLILCKLLFGGLGRKGFHHFGHHCGHGRDHGRGHHGKHAHFHEKMRNMSREERREFIRNRIEKGFRHFDDENEDEHEHEHHSSSKREE